MDHEPVLVSVHGPAGVLDLAVPVGAVVADVAREYAARAGLAVVPLLRTVTGHPLPPDRALEVAGVRAGDLLVAITSGRHHHVVRTTPPGGRRAGRPAPPGGTTGDRAGATSGTEPASAAAAPLATAAAVASAVLAGWAATDASAPCRDVVAVTLALGALVGLLPRGRAVAERAVAAPAFAGAAAYAGCEPGPLRLPVVVGACVLVAAVAAGGAAVISRSTAGRPAEPAGAAAGEEGLLVWVVGGGTVLLVAVAAAVAGAPAQLPWAVLLVLVALAARAVPAVAVSVPDQDLVDLDRLAGPAWSARDRATGRRDHEAVRPDDVAALALRGGRLLTASAAAVLATTVVATPLLLVSTDDGLDLVGARCLALLAGGALVLAARDHRHRAARALLRGAGLVAWGWLAATIALAPGVPGWVVPVTTPAAGALGAVCVAVAVAVGRGRRSVWCGRLAEVAESLCGAGALAALVVATGAFRAVWQLAA